MKGFWLTFTDGSHGYCQGESAYDAVQIAEHLTKKTVVVPESGNKYDPKLDTLPYPASPVIWQFDHPVMGKTPTFCMHPGQCKNRGSCPRSYACTE